MPYCMGSLFWQFNDCWPAISWSAVDYFYNPKLFYYQTKRLFKDVAPIIIERNDSVLFYVSNLKTLLGKENLSLVLLIQKQKICVMIHLV